MESSPSILPFKGNEEEVSDDHDDEDVLILLCPPHDIQGLSVPPSTSEFTFTRDHDSLLNVRIDSLTSSTDGLAVLLH